jgi:hypothetical protein
MAGKDAITAAIGVAMWSLGFDGTVTRIELNRKPEGPVVIGMEPPSGGAAG